MKLKKTYSFSLLSSVYLTISIVLTFALVYFLSSEEKKLLSILVFFYSIFFFYFYFINFSSVRLF